MKRLGELSGSGFYVLMPRLSRLAFYFLDDAFNVRQVDAISPVALARHSGPTLTPALLAPRAIRMVLANPTEPEADRTVVVGQNRSPMNLNMLTIKPERQTAVPKSAK